MVTKHRIRAYNSQVPLVLVNYLLQDNLYEKHGNMTKNTQSRKHISILHITKEKRGPKPGKIGPKQVENKDKTKSNQLIFAEHHHGPSQEA